MRRTLGSLAVLLALLWEPAVQAQQQIQFFASVVDEGGTPVAGLTPDDFTVMENGAPGHVLKVEPIDWPVKVSILVDNGAGLGAQLGPVRTGVKALIEALPEGTEISLVTLAPQPRFVRRSMTDRQALLQGVDRIAPDPGAAMFIDALREVASRMYAEKGNFFPVVIVLGSVGPEGSTANERSVNRMMGQFAERAATVHVVMVTSSRVAGVGANQIFVGTTVSKATGGRYDNIAAVSRIATLMPEIGQQVARSHALQSRQYRITAARPTGASGPPTRFTVSTGAGRTVQVTPDGHLP
jgi:hypothetical protein